MLLTITRSCRSMNETTGSCSFYLTVVYNVYLIVWLRRNKCIDVKTRNAPFFVPVHLKFDLLPACVRHLHCFSFDE